MKQTTYFAEITKDNFVMRTGEFNWVDILLVNVANFIEDMSLDATIEIKQVDRTDVNSNTVINHYKCYNLSNTVISHYKYYNIYELKDDVKKLSLI